MSKEHLLSLVRTVVHHSHRRRHPAGTTGESERTSQKRNVRKKAMPIKWLKVGVVCRTKV